MNFESELNSEQIMIAWNSTEDQAVKRMCYELLARRDADKARAAVPMPISRERLERIAEWGLSTWCWFSAQEQEALARFALAHMQQPLHSEAAKETEPMQEQARDARTHPRKNLYKCEIRSYLGLPLKEVEGWTGPNGEFMRAIEGVVFIAAETLEEAARYVGNDLRAIEEVGIVYEIEQEPR